MSDEGLTLEELSARTGVEARTLRSWVSEGLLAPPLKAGRGARYPAGNADRALAVRALKDLHGLSLSEIGRRFMMATEDRIRDWAREAGPTTAPGASARDYLRRIRAEDDARLPQRALGMFREAPPTPASDRSSFAAGVGKPPLLDARQPRPDDRAEDLASIERLILQLQKVLEAPAPRRCRGAVWTRIAVTPDLELSVRGALEPRERILFEQLADQFRAILTTGTSRDD